MWRYLFSWVYSPRIFERAIKVRPYAYKCKKSRQAFRRVHKFLWLPQCVKNVQESIKNAVMLFASVAHILLYLW